MMKIKKILVLILAILICAAMFFACDADETKDQPSDSQGNEQTDNENDNQDHNNEINNEGNNENNENNEENNENNEENNENNEEEDTLTKFEKQFSVENEQLLAEILAADIESGSVVSQLPDFSVDETSRINAGDGAWTYIYEKASKALYDEYCDALLKTKKYAQYTETEFNGTAYQSTKAVHNYFTTFLSLRAQVDIGFHDAFERMYVTVTPRKNSDLPLREAPTYTAAGGQYPTIWTQYGLEDINNQEASLGYIIRIADGSFIILDSGESLEGVEERMYEILKMQAPDPDNIVISAWILTHAHGDHVGGFIRFANQYGSDKSINVKQLVYNFPHDTNVASGTANYQNTVRTAASNFWSKPTFLKPHAGNVLYYADVAINILYTQEEHLAVAPYFENYNASSMVTQFVMGDGTKLLIGADHPVDGATWCEAALWKWYGSFLESYVVSTFHHGYGGGADSTIYFVIKSKIVLWSIDEYRVQLNSLKNSGVNNYFAGKKAADRGVLGYYIAGDDVVILSFADGKATVTQYDTFADYKAGIKK